MDEDTKQEIIDVLSNIEHDYDYTAMGCGLEDNNITDRYEAMYYGFMDAIKKVLEAVKNV